MWLRNTRRENLPTQAFLCEAQHNKDLERDVYRVERGEVLNIGGTSSRQKSEAGARIISGSQATRGQLPYMAAVYLDDRLFCGGSLISRRWLLTAASCAAKITKFTVHLGAQNLYKVDEPGRVIIETTQKILHHAFNSTTVSHDIALVNLGQEVTMNEYIQAVGLASGDDFVGDTARISGWGKIYGASVSLNPELMYVDVNVISQSECKITYGASIIKDFHICTQGSGTKGWCNGDSGGPLVEQASGKQIGIASFLSHLGCEKMSPNGYTRVSYYACWIQANTGVCS